MVTFEETTEKVIDFKSPKVMKAMVVAAAGKLNMIFHGAPGCGKTLLMQKMPLLLPDNTQEESETVHPGLKRPNDKIDMWQPFRMPHQTTSIEGMYGGGPNCRPGEISLAHNGVLFLDEAAEFRTSILQLLRVPLTNKSITLSRAGRSTTYPANFQLLMATNPCPCGNYGNENKICLCSKRAISEYWRKFSPPLTDRIEIRLNIDFNSHLEIPIEQVRTAIARAVETQRNRGVYNKDIKPEDIPDLISAEVASVIPDTLSPRRKLSVIKIARTVADLDGNEIISKKDIMEALELNESLPVVD